ncbi:hypothetical protein GF326_06320 [Candidatus Bathyarchaeota archaeon]|nr:hypothetical protein [Candidatus Bathyarchaeota archaeon]
MRLNGWLLDVRLSDYGVHLWVKTGEKRTRFSLEYQPDFYVVPRSVSFNEFLDLFDEHPHILVLEKTKRYTSLSSPDERPVIRVAVDAPDFYRSVVGQVEKYGEIYDDSLSHTQRFLADHGLIPLGEVSLDADEKHRIQSIEPIPLNRSLEPPPFKVLCFESYHEDELSFITYDETIREEHRFRGEVEETLDTFMEHIREENPDFLCCIPSDMKTLLKLCEKYGQLSLGYYQRKSFHLEKGRVFLNLKTYRRTSLAGILERIMYTREVPRIGSDWAAGRAIESRQSYEASRRGYLLPRRGFYQPMMSLGELIKERDHGGLIFAPRVGLHVNVAALDFESMFPHLIIRENISYENIDEEQASEGFLLDFTRDTLERRLYFKHMKKELRDQPEKWFWCETRQQALKEILFCTYGYSGCWANKFGNMNTFMEINKAARNNLVDAMNVAREEGFQTLYGNTDSLFLKKKEANKEDFDFLAALIQEKMGLPITVENHYRYLVLLPQKSDEAFGAINRYYGIRYDGELVCRGIELRRRNTPQFIADTQRESIRILLSHDSPEEIACKGVKQVKRLINKRNRELKQGLVPLNELEAKTILRRKPSRYKTRLPHVTAAKALEINGKEVDRGGIISYIYVDSSHSNPFRRVSPAGYQKKFDYKKYQHLLFEAEKSILLPFLGNDEEPKAMNLDRFF